MEYYSEIKKNKLLGKRKVTLVYIQKYKKVEEPLYLTSTNTRTQFFSKVSFKKHNLFFGADYYHYMQTASYHRMKGVLDNSFKD